MHANKKLTPKNDTLIQWHTKAGSVNTNIRVKIHFTLTKLSATKIVTCNCYVDHSAKEKYKMILGRYLWTALGLNLRLSDHVIEANGGNFKMVDMGCTNLKI